MPAIVVLLLLVFNFAAESAGGEGLQQRREILVRRQIRDLRLEEHYVRQRLTDNQREQQRVLLQMKIANAGPGIENQVAANFQTREDGLQERLAHVSRLLTAAEKRLAVLEAKSARPHVAQSNLTQEMPQ